MYKKILVATDLLSKDQVVLTKAAGLAKEWSATLWLLTIVEPLPSYGYAYVGAAEVETNLLEEAKQQLSTLGDKFGVPATRQLVDLGTPKADIVRLAKEQGVDLIILGSHSRHGLSQLLGSTANAVLHRAECDVLTVRVG